jgi:hypothetical protein
MMEVDVVMASAIRGTTESFTKFFETQPSLNADPLQENIAARGFNGDNSDYVLPVARMVSLYI